MKIAILSMQRVYNYGSFLQAYGLKRLVEKRGHSVSFLDIDPGEKEGTFLEKGTAISDHRRKYDRYLLQRQIYKNRAKKRNKIFEHNWREILHMDEKHVVSIPCDAVIIGSDEVFNCNKANPWGISLQLFGKIDCAPIILSYAASCGYTSYHDVPEDYKFAIAGALNNLKVISVRDNNTHEFVKSLCGRDAEYNLDPVLIYDFCNEVEEIEKNMDLPSKYMIVYAYKNRIKEKKDIDAIKMYAKKNRLKIVSLGDSQYWADDYIVLDPFQMLVYFKHADCVVTDTFHGTIMAAKYHRKLAVIVRDSNRNKLQDLLIRLGIENHKMQNLNEIINILDQKDDYSIFDTIIKENREKTQMYFENAGL